MVHESVHTGIFTRSLPDRRPLKSQHAVVRHRAAERFRVQTAASAAHRGRASKQQPPQSSPPSSASRRSPAAQVRLSAGFLCPLAQPGAISPIGTCLRLPDILTILDSKCVPHGHAPRETPPSPLQRSGEGKDDLAAEIDRLRAENARIRHKLKDAASTLQQGGAAGDQIERIAQALGGTLHMHFSGHSFCSLMVDLLPPLPIDDGVQQPLVYLQEQTRCRRAPLVAAAGPHAA